MFLCKDIIYAYMCVTHHLYESLTNVSALWYHTSQFKFGGGLFHIFMTYSYDIS